jgi:lipoprotein-anchoring transpeptidase ErfK/SrfK
MGTRERRSGIRATAAMVIFTAACAFAEEKAKGTRSPAGDGTQTSTRRIVVSIPDRKLALLDGDRVVKVWPTAVGSKATPSPGGTCTIVNRVANPAYYRPGQVVKPGASNPVGTRWLGLSLKGFGIHGTNVPGSIGKKASHGCIRMLNRDIEELFDLVQVGDVVELHTRRDMDETEAAIFSKHAPRQTPEVPVLTASAQ